MDRNYASQNKGTISGVAPSRGRGSKPSWKDSYGIAFERRPLAGAWIETCSGSSGSVSARVAPSRGRGSKLFGIGNQLM